jgi:hypothetical protein
MISKDFWIGAACMSLALFAMHVSSNLVRQVEEMRGATPSSASAPLSSLSYEDKVMRADAERERERAERDAPQRDPDQSH